MAAIAFRTHVKENFKDDLTECYSIAVSISLFWLKFVQPEQTDPPCDLLLN